MYIFNRSKSVVYFNKINATVYETIKKEVVIESIPFISFEAFKSRGLRGLDDHIEDEVVPGWTDLPPMTGWTWDGSQLHRLKQRLPVLKPENKHSFLDYCAQYFNHLQARKVAVHASGGLDTSLVIGIMRELKIPFSLIGLKNGRYEFRTETFIQDKYADFADFCAFVDYENYLPYSHLKYAPAHVLPDFCSINYSAELAMANLCEKAGIDVLITGAGGDLIMSSARKFEEFDWDLGSFYMPFLREYIYKPKGVRLEAFFSNNAIACCLWNLRRGEDDDPKKRWAREFFSNLLIDELSQYTYKSDFWGLYVDGLRNAKNEIIEMNEFVYEVTKNPAFSEKAIRSLIGVRLEDCNEQSYKNIDTNVSLVIWLHSLLQN